MGLGHAVWCARRLIANEPFAVILPDDVIAADKPCLQQMVEAYEDLAAVWSPRWRFRAKRPRPMVFLDVAEDNGSSGVRARDGRKAEGRSGTVQSGGDRTLYPDPRCSRKPQQGQKSGAGGEIQLTDAIAAEVGEGRQVHGLNLRGQRFDCGSKAGFLQATVSFALSRQICRTSLPRTCATYLRWSGRPSSKRNPKRKASTRSWLPPSLISAGLSRDWGTALRPELTGLSVRI